MWSKTKIGASLIGLSAIFGTLGAWFSGTIESSSAINALILEVGAVYAAFGIRDMPFINRTK